MNWTIFKPCRWAMVATLALASSQAVLATELVHRFVDPSLGGNPLNGTALMNQANEQNTYKDPTAASRKGGIQSPLERFKQSLQSALLNRISYSSVDNIIDKTTGLVIPGATLSFDMSGVGGSGIFNVNVGQVDQSNHTVTITIDDGSGSNTSITVPYPASNAQ